MQLLVVDLAGVAAGELDLDHQVASVGVAHGLLEVAAGLLRISAQLLRTQGGERSGIELRAPGLEFWVGLEDVVEDILQLGQIGHRGHVSGVGLHPAGPGDGEDVEAVPDRRHRSCRRRL